MVFVSTDKNKEVSRKYTELWNGIKYLIKTINGGEESEHERKNMKIKFKSEENLPLNKTLKPYNFTIIARSVFQQDSRYYPQFFWMNVCMNCKC